MSIIRWDDLSEVKTFLWTETESWGLDYYDTGSSHNRNAWAVNSQKWLCIHIGFGTRGARGTNQMLINWQDEQRIVVTENQDDESPRNFDDAGDFWIGSDIPQPPQITLQPQDQSVTVGQRAQFTVQASGTPPLSCRWQRDGNDIGNATFPEYFFVAGMNDNGAGFRCVVSNAQGSVTSDMALLTVHGDSTPPSLEQVTAPGSPVSVWVTFSEPVEKASSGDASNYSIDKGVEVTNALRQDDQSIVLLTVSELSDGQTYTLTANNVRDQAPLPNTIAPNSTSQFTYTNQNQPPVVNAGLDATVRVGDDLLLNGIVDDDGLPSGSINYRWEFVSGPGQVTSSASRELSTFARFDVPGEYVLRLIADDGDKTGEDEILVSVLPRPSMTVTSPSGGELWQAGSVQTIQWSAVGITNVSLDYSTDDGLNWSSISHSIDANNDPALWGHYPWTIPDDPTDHALIQLTVYSDPANAVRSGVFSILGSGGDQSIRLLGPVEGEILDGNCTFNITWQTVNVDTVLIEFSYDAGVSWESLSMVDSSQTQWLSYPWKVPDIATCLALVRIRTLGGATQDVSELFTIEPETGPVEDVAVNKMVIHAHLPPDAQGVDSVEVGGKDFPVDDGVFDAELESSTARADPTGLNRFSSCGCPTVSPTRLGWVMSVTGIFRTLVRNP